jgi:hypothetical protein
VIQSFELLYLYKRWSGLTSGRWFGKRAAFRSSPNVLQKATKGTKLTDGFALKDEGSSALRSLRYLL